MKPASLVPGRNGSAAFVRVTSGLSSKARGKAERC